MGLGGVGVLTLEGLFSYAGLPELTARVRPSRRSAGVTEEVAGG